MYDLHLTSEQLEIRDMVRDFAAGEIKPLALAAARLEAPHKPLLVDVLAQASRLGLRTLALAEETGGAGADGLTCCIVAEELAVADPDLATVLARTAMLAPLLFDRWMTPDQRERFLPRFLADDRCHLALAHHEPGSDGVLGIDYHRPMATRSAPSTTAVRSGEMLVINGKKDRVVNAPLAGLFAVDVAVGTGGVATLLVPRDTPGLGIVAEEDGARWFHGVRGALTFEDCRVPTGNLLDRKPHAGCVRVPLELAINLGIGRAAYEAALDHARLRVQGGRPIVEHQAIGTKLAEIAVRLDVARTVIWRAAWAADHPDAVADRSLPDLPLAAIAEVFSSEAIYRAAKDAAECFGATGVMRDVPVHKHVHDALVCLHSGAGNNDTKLRIAEVLADYRRPAAAAAAE